MRTVTDELTREYRFWLRFASSHQMDLTPAEEAILEVEPTLSQGLIRRLMALNDPQETGQAAPEADVELESILQARRALLESAVASDDAETLQVAATSNKHGAC